MEARRRVVTVIRSVPGRGVPLPRRDRLVGRLPGPPALRDIAMTSPVSVETKWGVNAWRMPATHCEFVR